MKFSTTPSVDRLREVLHYAPETGILTWLISGHGIFLNSEAGFINPDGYMQIRIDRLTRLAHRLAWALHHGEHPQTLIDHKNGIRTDNRIDNLRLCTTSQNQQNKAPLNGRFKGVTALPSGRFQAQINVSGVQLYLGTHDAAEDAAAAYDTAARTHFGEFARLNFKGASHG